MVDTADERVRSCLGCGELVPFDERRCPSCGHYEPLAGGVEPGPERPCRRCGKHMSADLLFCPHCGTEQEQGLLLGAAPATGEAERGSSGPARLVVAATLLGPVVVALVVFGVLLG